ncbi:MAG: archaeosortase A [Methanophagales archaeon ANME-1-THS]|nr:MAG: archaeosortase A [Methanophagales archaeon ANME-1-THS]
MIVKSIFPFIAISFFLLAVVLHNKSVFTRTRSGKESSSLSGEVRASLLTVGKVAGALGWLAFAVYCIFEVLYYLMQGEYYDTSLAVVFLAFSILMAGLLLNWKLLAREEGADELLFTITKIALICAVLYFPFSEVAHLGRLLIYLTTRITVAVLNLFNVGVYIVYPSSIYTTQSSFHEIYKPIEIILACTAIESMVLFTGLVFGVTAAIDRKVKAFFVSVPIIYLLNIARNVFVTAAYFGEWFGSPLQSFYIAHGIIARIFVMASLIVIAYAVFIILPESLDVIEDFFRMVLRKRRR